MSFEFEWDPAKSDANFKKHGVAFSEALAVFADPLARIFDDPDHSDDEKREIIIGQFREPTPPRGVLHRTIRQGPSDQRAHGHEARAHGL
jgi:uncharacterized DUF497 family protein